MALKFHKATKIDAKLRLALCGPAGAGKTFTALTLAREIAGPDGKVAYVDTEHGSASKYADVFTFDCTEPDAFDPRELIDTIDYAVANGYVVICIDSLSHYWAGPGGELEMVDSAAARTKGNTFAAWKTVTPVHNQLVDKIIGAKIHIIVTMRTKTEWVIDKDERTGKSTPRKIGLQPIMREGVEYTFDLCGDLDQDNTLTITKSRCSALSGKVIQRPGKPMADSLKAWLIGEPAPVPPPTTTPAPTPAPSAAVPQQQPTTPAPAPTQAPPLVVDKGKDRFKEMLAQFSDIKTKVSATQYYDVLKQFGVAHANEFRDMTVATNCYKALKVAATINGPKDAA